MIFEHFALNVPDARALARWYVQHLSLRILRERAEAPYTTFLGDDTGRVFFEIYSNPTAPCHEHAQHHQLMFHFAFFTRDAVAERDRLVAAGATPLADETLADGSRLLFVRDPWGHAVQLCQRAQPFPGF